MENPLVSVVIPTYNRAGLIENTIDSVINQTYKNLEIIIVDDGSNDNTEEVIRNIDDCRIIYVYQENAGPSAARNNGIRHAKGEYVAFLDSDDIWLPEKIEKQVVLLDKINNLGIVSCSYENLENNQRIKKRFRGLNNSKTFLINLMLEPQKNPKCPSFMLIKKDCFKKVGYFDERLKSLEDWDLWLRICIEYEFYCLDEMLVIYNAHDNSLSRNTDIINYENCYLKFLDKVFQIENLPEYIRKIKNKCYSYAYWNIAWKAVYHSKNKIVAKKYIFRSYKYNPITLLKLNYLIALILSFLPDKFIYFYKEIRRNLKRV